LLLLLHALMAPPLLFLASPSLHPRFLPIPMAMAIPFVLGAYIASGCGCWSGHPLLLLLLLLLQYTLSAVCLRRGRGSSKRVP